MMFMFEGLSDEETDQSIMEVLAYRHSFEHLDREGIFRAIFKHFDKDCSVGGGAIEVLRATWAP